MSHSVPIAEELYRKIEAYAAERSEHPDTLIEAWLGEAIRRATELSAEEQTAAKVLSDPLFQVAGIFAGNEPGWGRRHDELLAEAIEDAHADEQ